MKTNKMLGAILFVVICTAIIYPSLSTNIESAESSDGIRFIHQDFQKAIAKAKSENKLVFVDAYASWCGPCKVMDKKVFSNDEVGDYFNRKFVSVKVMVEDSQKATPEGIQFSQKYQFDAYPTMFFLDGDGKVVKKIVGYHDARQLLKEAEKIAG